MNQNLLYSKTAQMKYIKDLFFFILMNLLICSREFLDAFQGEVVGIHSHSIFDQSNLINYAINSIIESIGVNPIKTGGGD